MPAKKQNENTRTTVMRFDKSCTIQLTIIEDSKVNIILYNDIDRTIKTGSCKLKGAPEK